MSESDEPTIVVFPDQVVRIAPDGIFNLACVAKTLYEARCETPVDRDDAGRWDVLFSKRGRIFVYDVADAPAEVVRRLLAQHCDDHAAPGTGDAAAMEWQEPDFDGAHAHLVDELPEDWEW